MAIYFERLGLQKLLSFGADAEPITLGELNVLIGPNGSGKSNLLEAIGLLAATPRGMSEALRAGGGIEEWIWKGAKKKRQALLEVWLRPRSIKYELSVWPESVRHAMVEERIEQTAAPAQGEPVLYFGHRNGKPYIRREGTLRKMDATGHTHSESILSQRKDPSAYPELFELSELFQSIRFYRDWSFGRGAPSRMPQPADLPNDYLMEDARNLGLMLNRIRKNPEAKEALLTHLAQVYEDVRDVDVSIEGGTLQVFLHEKGWVVPSTRLSAGTLRWLCLLTVLLNPAPQSLVCIEEPETGLHPELLPSLARLLRAASERMQLIVTTHSSTLVQALADTPESVLVCEKHEGSTRMRRLDQAGLADWLGRYTRGQARR